MLNYMKSSLKNLFTNAKGSLALLLMAQVFSVVVIVFSYGIINHYNTKVDEAESISLIHEFNLKSQEELGNEGIYMELGELYNFFNRVLPKLENKIDYFFIMGQCGEYRMMSSNGYEEGKCTVSSQIERKVGIKEGEKFTDEDMAEGTYCILATEELDDGSGHIMLGDEKYKIKGIVNTAGLNESFYVPYGAIPETADIYHISFILEKPMLETEYNLIANAIKDCFGDKVIIPEFSGIINESNNRVYRDIMVVSIVLIFVFAIDYCIIYRYILEKRRRIFAVSRICGGPKLKISIVYMMELLGMSLITLIVGILAFHNVVLSRATDMFEYIYLYCNIDVYIRLGGIYMVILFVVYMVLISRFVRKTPVSLMKEV